MSYYAVANGRHKGIFLTWDECKKSVIGYNNAKYKKFNNMENALNFVKNDNIKNNNIKNNNIKNNNIKNNNIKNNNIKNNNIKNNNVDYYVYTDGSCSNNGKMNSTAGIGIYFGENDSRNVSMKLEGKQTNNTAELSAIIILYKIIENDINKGMNITIVSDSRYAILCAMSNGKIYEKNKELVKIICDLYKDKHNVKFMHVMAHTNLDDIHSIGNMNADKLANNAHKNI